MARKATAVQLEDRSVIFREKPPRLKKQTDKPKQQRTESKTPPASGDTTIKKVSAPYSPRGKRGQKYLVSGISLSLRLWEDEHPGRTKAKTRRAYETVGYVLAGRAELQVAKQKVLLEPGDSWVVPKEVLHQYRILEPFTALEATCPPARVHGRDE